MWLVPPSRSTSTIFPRIASSGSCDPFGPKSTLRSSGRIPSVIGSDDADEASARLSIFTFAPHPFYVLGGSIGERLLEEIDCFDAIELCHFHKGLLNPNRRAAKVAARFGTPMIATSDAHQLHAFGRHYTSIPRPRELTIENVFAALRKSPLRLTSPPASIVDLASAIYWIFLAHPFKLRKTQRRDPTHTTPSCSSGLESKSQT